MKVSIIIAIYNVERYLERCLDSILNQSYPEIEIIAVNDGSTDDSLSIIRTYAAKDERIIIVDKANGGLSDARNAGLNIARGKFIAFLDGDDTYDTDFVLKMLAEMQEKGCDLACCNYTYVWQGETKIKEKNFLKNLSPTLNQEEAVKAFLRQEIIGSVTIKMFRRDIIQEFGLQFPKGQNWEDMIFTFRYLVHVSLVGILKESLYYYLQSDSSITRKKESLGILDNMKAAKDCIEQSQIVFPGKFKKETQALLTRSFICLLVYSFKCKNKQVKQALRTEIQTEGRNTSLSLLFLKEKLMIVLYRIHYNLACWVFFLFTGSINKIR